MYIALPLAIFVLAILLIAIIAGRKFVYLRKLDTKAITESPANKKTFWPEMFPEFVSAAEKIKWREHRLQMLTESEKSLRKLRLFFLKIEAFTHRLINSIRRSTKHDEQILIQQEKEEERKEELKKEEILETKKDPKEEEQHLIMRIAQNPKDAELYRELGMLYIEMGSFDEAIQCFQAILLLDPADMDAKNRVEELKERSKKETTWTA